jgi:hypothetical protein
MPTAPIVCCHVSFLVHDHGALARRCARTPVRLRAWCEYAPTVRLRAWCGCDRAYTSTACCTVMFDHASPIWCVVNHVGSPHMWSLFAGEATTPVSLELRSVWDPPQGGAILSATPAKPVTTTGHSFFFCEFQPSRHHTFANQQNVAHICMYTTCRRHPWFGVMYCAACATLVHLRAGALARLAHVRAHSACVRLVRLSSCHKHIYRLMYGDVLYRVTDRLCCQSCLVATLH